MIKKRSDNKDENPAKADTTNDGNILHQVIKRPFKFTTDGIPKDEYEYQKKHEYKISQQVDALLGGDIDPNATNNLRETPLALAIQNQMLQVAFVLLHNKVRPEIQDTDGDNALHLLAMERVTWYAKKMNIYGLSKRQAKFFLNKMDSEHKEALLILSKAVIEIARAQETNLLTTKNNKGEQPPSYRY